MTSSTKEEQISLTFKLSILNPTLLIHLHIHTSKFKPDKISNQDSPSIMMLDLQPQHQRPSALELHLRLLHLIEATQAKSMKTNQLKNLQ